MLARVQKPSPIKMSKQILTCSKQCSPLLLLIKAVFICLTAFTARATNVVVATTKTPERIMEHCKPKGKNLPHNANVQIGVIERGNCNPIPAFETRKQKLKTPFSKSFSKFHTETAEVKYVAYFYKNCSVFDAFYEEKELKIEHIERKPLYPRFVKGFAQGLTGMCEGELRRIIVPSKLAYGRHGAAYIPGNTTLVYEVEMVKLSNKRYNDLKRAEESSKRRRL